MKDSLYHTILRVSALTLTLVLLFVSGFLAPVTKELSQNAGTYLANAIGIYAGVEPNELNVITAELTKQKTELDAREKALSEREINVDVGSGGSTDTSTFILSAILFIILVLIILNYILDYLRARAVSQYEQAT